MQRKIRLPRFISQRYTIGRLGGAAMLCCLLGGPAGATRPPESKSRSRHGVGAATKLSTWKREVERTRARQARWITPLVTLTPLLEQEYRFDLIRQAVPGGAVWQLDAGLQTAINAYHAYNHAWIFS